MADSSLNQPVIVRAIGLNAASIPAGYSPAYAQYILSQATDFTKVAGKANEAGQGAYEAQTKNDEQDVTIHFLEVRITTAEGNIITLRSDVDYLLDEVIDIQAHLVTLDSRVTATENNVVNLQADYISKSAVASQNLASPLNVTTSYSVGGVKVIGARQTGWTAGTGTALLGAFNANQSFTVSNPPTQAEVQTIAAALVAVRQRNLALEQMARTHGLIN